MARGAGGLRHVGAAALDARADSCWDVTALQRRASARSLCNRGCGDFAASYRAACCVFCSGTRSWLAALDARGAFRGRQEVQVLFTGTTGVLLTKAGLWAKHRDGRGGEESSPGDELDIDPRCRRGRKHITHLPSKKSAVSLDKSHWKHAVTAEQHQQYLCGSQRCVGAVYVSKKVRLTAPCICCICST